MAGGEGACEAAAQLGHWMGGGVGRVCTRVAGLCTLSERGEMPAVAPVEVVPFIGQLQHEGGREWEGGALHYVKVMFSVCN